MPTSARRLTTALLLAGPALVRAQENAGPTPVPTESKLWWMWLVIAVLLVAGLVAIFLKQEPRSRAAERERARRIVHGRDEPRTSER